MSVFYWETIFPSAVPSVNVSTAHATRKCIFTFLLQSLTKSRSDLLLALWLPATNDLFNAPSLPGMGPVSRLWPEITQDFRLPLLTPLNLQFHK